eukprot:8845165-Alexandrium_andersonii.AAC.1
MSHPSLASSGKTARMRRATSSMPTPFHFSVYRRCCGAYWYAEKTMHPFPLRRGLIIVGKG